MYGNAIVGGVSASNKKYPTSADIALSAGGNAGSAGIYLENSNLYLGYTEARSDGTPVNTSKQTLNGGIFGNFNTGEGGGVFIEGGKLFMSSGEIAYNNVYKYNSQTRGGGIRAHSNTSIEICGGEIHHNAASSNYGEGGAILIMGDTNKESTLTITDCEIYENEAQNGAGIYIDDSYATFYMSGGRIYSNTAKNKGGAIYNNGNTYIYDTAIIGEEGTKLTAKNDSNNKPSNKAKYGGGIYNDKSTPSIGKLYLGYSAADAETGAPTTIANWTGGIYRNLCESSGAGIYNTTGIIYMNSGTIQGNFCDGEPYYNYLGGGLVVATGNNGKVYMTGGVIKENRCKYEDTKGSGVYYNYGDFRISGNACILPDTVVDGSYTYITNDVYINNTEKSIIVTDELNPTTDGSSSGTTTDYTAFINLPTTDLVPDHVVIKEESPGSTSQACTKFNIDPEPDDEKLFSIGTNGKVVLSITTTVSRLQSVLSSLPENTITTSYKVLVTNVTTDDFGNKNIKKALDNAKRYVDISFTLSNGVTEIPASSFEYCNYIGKITIPEGITTIGNYALSANSNYTSFKEIILPNSLTTIGDNAFAYCAYSSLAIPENVTTIGEYAFKGAKNLTSISLPSGVLSIGNYAFSGCENMTTLVFNGTNTTLGNGLCSSCKKLSSVTLPSALETIPSYMFNTCEALQSISIPESVKSIGTYAFEKSGIKSITIPKNVESIGSSAFNECKQLKTITFNTTKIKQINSYTFKRCETLESVVLPEGVEKICSYAFAGYKTAGTAHYGSATGVTIPTSVTIIEDYAFSENSRLTSITFKSGSKLESIGDYAFTKCVNLTTISIPAGNNLNVGKYLFNDCTNLTTATISCKNISDSMFSGCNAFTTITINNGVESIGSQAFRNTKLGSVSIPSSVKSIKKDAFYMIKGGSGSTNYFTSATFGTTNGWKVTKSNETSNISFTNGSDAATKLNNTYVDYDWSHD